MLVFTSVDKKWRMFRAWVGGYPLWCGWQVTYRCNFRCRFCHYWADPMGSAPEPTLEDYALGARKLAGFGTMMISLAGGEPLLRPDLPEIVSEIAKYHFPFVTTNGWLVTRDTAQQLMEAGVWGVSVSIDYAHPRQHDKRRGVDGAWEQGWRAVELLSEVRVHKHQRVNVIAVLMDDNIDEIGDLARMAERRGAYFMVQPYGQLKTGSSAYVHNNGAVVPRLLELRENRKNFLSNPCYLERFDEFLAGGVADCRAGRAFFNIDSTGDIAICVEQRKHPIANLYRHSSATIHNRLRSAAKGNSCTSCWYNCRGEVESLYHPRGLWKSLPTLLLDRGRPTR